MSEVVDSVEVDGGVLVGHDGSTASGEAVRWAADHAASLGKPLHVLRAWSITDAPRPPSAEQGYIPPLVDYQEAVREKLTADVAALGLPAEVEVHLHVAHGRTTHELLVAAQGADLLVVGRRGGGGFRGLGFGSTADQVVRHAPCPVIAVPVDAGDR